MTLISRSEDEYGDPPRMTLALDQKEHPMTPSTALVIDRGAGTATQQLQARMATVLEVMANVLEDTKDYGRIPGTDKPTLYKPGAEKLMLTFQLAAASPRIEDLSTSDEIRYRVAVPIESRDCRVIAVGIGEASSNEEKYRWRKPVCDEEYAETPEHLRREKWFKGQSKPYKGKQIRTSPADLANTILKMGHKRAFIHGTLLATGASSVFNQDLEDFSKELRDAIVDHEETAAPLKKPTVQRASATGGKTSAAGPAAEVQVTEPRRVIDVRQVVDKKGKPYWILSLEGDAHEYTTRDATQALELEQFKSTDHAIRASYKVNDWQGKVYYNLEHFAVADAPAPSGPPLTSGDIPFGK
jgi:hypothetical protein